ncbi:hypothetical protein HYDPIDRAFT_106320 [Hydnomerulius pinastri MD-312]|nr:hypothetical protein HYDPIDRAFT_106320 [Hydnomerulius pinastri MD-312]
MLAFLSFPPPAPKYPSNLPSSLTAIRINPLSPLRENEAHYLTQTATRHLHSAIASLSMCFHTYISSPE